jgi:hypothetical protein
MVGLAATLIGCAQPEVIGVPCTAFEPVDIREARAKLIGGWRSARETLVLLPNRKFTAGRTRGCWDVRRGTATGGLHIVFAIGCVNYDNEEIFLAAAKPGARCEFTVGDHLALSGCVFAGEYRRE